MLLADVAETSARVADRSRRLDKIDALAELLARCDDDELRPVVSWLSGALTQRQIGVGWAALRAGHPPADTPSLTVTDAEDAFARIGAARGSGSQRRRAELLRDLMGAATPAEQAFLHGLLGGGLRQGALGGVLTDAVARANQVPVADVRRAAMLTGDLARTALLARDGGREALRAVRLSVGMPVSPMLAATAASAAEAVAALGGRAIVDTKLDGARIQVHRRGDRISVYTRSLDDVTDRLPEVVEAVAAIDVGSLVVDGEAIALREDGSPEPFQVTASRFGRRTEDEQQRPLTPVLFDLLHVDGRDLLDDPLHVRAALMAEVLPAELIVGRILDATPEEAERFTRTALDAGHEGIVAKARDSPYQAGRRGSGWLKVKPVHTLDLVVLAVEWGSGRRRGTLSNIHLGARDPDGGFVMLGKTFKGMTDEMLAWQTRRFTELADGPTDGYLVRVRPEQVVEIAFDGVQRSSRYPGGVALRFARVLCYRDDKPAAQADTIDTVRSFLR